MSSTEKTIDEMIESVSDQTGLEVDEVRDRAEERFEDLKEHKSSEVGDDVLMRHAVSVVNSEEEISAQGFGGGESEQFPLLALGYQTREGDRFVTDGDAIHGGAIINPPERPAGYAVVIIDTEHGVDFEHAKEAFTPLNTIRAVASIRRVGSRDGEPSIEKNGNPTYVVTSNTESTFEIVDPDDASDDDPISSLPRDREAKRDLINDNFFTEEETFTVKEYAENLAATNDDGYAIAFGADAKRIRGEVVDAIRFEGGGGNMTIVDETIYSEDDVPTELIADERRTPGLTVGIAGELVYGENSILDLYGHVVQFDSGQYTFQATGVIPIVEYEYDGGVVGGDSDEEDDAIESDTI